MPSFEKPLIVLLVLFVSPASAESLYSRGDPIVELTAANFGQTIPGTPNAWLVEFYTTWCGHCQRFAPIFKELATYVRDWGHVIRVGAVACSDPQNAAFCRRAQIWGYPTLKFYPPQSHQNIRGQMYIGAKTVDAMRRKIVEYTMSWPDKPSTWPNFQPARDSGDILSSVPEGISTILVVTENSENPDLAKELLLDLSSWPGVYARRMVHQGAPSGVSAMARDGSLTTIARGSDRDTVRARVNRYLRAERPVSAAGVVTPREPDRTTPTAIISETSTNGLHMQDLESGLYYSLILEVGSRDRISGSRLAALQAYIDVLSKYFPGNPYIMNLLEKMRTWILGVRTPITGEMWIEKISELQTEDAYLPDVLRWTGCGGSEARYRGYPCSVWMIFHALTVNALENRNMVSERDPLRVLRAMRHYIHFFFGCRECAEHFETMAKSMEAEVRSHKESVLWLWRAHNRVNLRLAGDQTEDPRHPKHEFPPAALCPTCRISSSSSSHVRRGDHGNHTEWNEEEVIIFLRRFYGADFTIPDTLNYQFTPKTTPTTTTTTTATTMTTTTTTTERPTPAPTPRPTRPRVIRPGRPVIPVTTTPPPTTTTAPPVVNQPDPVGGAAGCQYQSFDWSPCSVTCGSGTSTRISNENKDCRMELETRICQTRPCDYRFVEGRRDICGATYRGAQFSPLVYAECRSVTLRQWRYCGTCRDKCCHVIRSQTVNMPFVCGKDFNSRIVAFFDVHLIGLCECSDTCP